MTDSRQHMETSPRAAPGLSEETMQTRQAMEQLKTQLRESEDRYRTLFDSLDEGFCIIEKVEGEAGAPPDFRFLEANPAFAARSGLSNEVGAAGVVGKTMRQLFPGEAEGWLPTYDTICRTGEPIRFEREFTTLGRVLELYAFRVADQTHGRVAINFHDITERKQAEEAQRQSEERFRAVVTASSDLMCRMSPDWREMRQLYGKNAIVDSTVSNANWLESYVYRDDQPRLMALVTEAIRTKSLFEMEHRVRHEDGSVGWMLSRAVPLLDAKGEIVEWFGTGSNVTERKRAEKALLESERFLRSCLDALSGHIAVLDESGTILEINEAWQRFGDENQALDAGIGVGVNYLQHCEQPLSQDDQTQACARGIKDVIAGRKTHFEMEYPCHSPTEQRWFDMRVTRFKGPGPVRIIIVHDNCTERKRAEQTLRENEERYRNLFNSIDEGFCVIELLFDELKKPIDYRFLEVNPAFEKHSGLHDVTGKRLRELVPDIEQQWIDISAKVALTGEAIRFTHEANALDRRWFDVYAFRLDEPASSRVALLFNNITVRKQAEQALAQLNAILEQRVQTRAAELTQANADLRTVAATKELLRESTERLLTVAENLSEGLVIASMEGEFIHWNRPALVMHGFASMAECRGQLADFTTLVEIKTLAGAVLPFNEWPMARALRGERLQNCELRIRRTDTGIARILNYSGTTVRDSAGKQSAFLTVTDITERKRAEAQLHELNDTLERRVLERTQALAELDRRKDEFLAMLGHELRNPLAALSNAVQMMRRHKHEDPLLLQGRAIIGRQLGHLIHLVDDLLEVARINSGSVRLRQLPVKLSGIVERALETAQPLILQHRHQLTLALPPGPIFLHADAARLEQVLVNLLTNAAKYTNDGGRIDLSVELEDAESDDAGLSMVLIKVRDSGIGIEPALLPHIFDLFTQAERSLDRSQGGLGIGLCLVQRLVQLHGGSVEAHSVLGQGSEFVVRLPAMPLPLTALPESPVPASESAAPSKKSSSGCRVLVVDDNVDAAQSLAKLLEMTGHETLLAYDGTSALQAAIDYRPEVVLLDIGLPGLDGYEVAERIRQQDGLKGVVLVALTGYGQDSDRQRSQEAGFDHHLVKPCDFDEIEKILDGVATLRKT
jgi:PAS domain S-box-containing protein